MSEAPLYAIVECVRHALCVYSVLYVCAARSMCVEHALCVHSTLCVCTARSVCVLHALCVYSTLCVCTARSICLQHTLFDLSCMWANSLPSWPTYAPLNGPYRGTLLIKNSRPPLCFHRALRMILM